MPRDKASTPYLSREDGRVQLIVGGKPFIMLAGEVHNSSASSLEYMANHVWDTLTAARCNTAIVPVYWELVEPEEGVFDFSLVDSLLDGARLRGLRLVLLWFATWKNATSTYAPAWVKTDLRRFFRAQASPGQNSITISPLCTAACQADSRAFAALMRHLKEADSEHRTVIMVQVENEAGLLGAARDMCPQADEAYAQAVPGELVAHLEARRDEVNPELKRHWTQARGATGDSWEEVFGQGAPEVFMAWYVARFVNAVAEAGKTEYPLPMYANAWLVQEEGQLPGAYPSGGPVAKMMDVWQAAAPAVDALAPDIYLSEFSSVCAEYRRSGNPLIIPEAKLDGAEANVFAAVAQHDALCFAPFGIDSLDDAAPLAESYAFFTELMPIITDSQGSGRMMGIAQGTGTPLQFALGGYHIRIAYTRQDDECRNRGRGLVVALSESEYLVAGAGFTITWDPLPAGPQRVQFLSVDEGTYRAGAWKPGRRLNGDEAGASSLRLTDSLTAYRVKLFSYD